MRSFQRHLAEFDAHGIQVVGVSVDSPAESSKLSHDRGYTFPILSDPSATAVRAYGILHAHGGPDARDIARPAEFLVDRARTIRWENLTENLLIRLRPETVFSALDSKLSAN